MTFNASLSDLLGAAFVTCLFVGTILIFSAGRRKVEQQFDQQSDKLKSKGLEVSSSGINVQTRYHLSPDQLVQQASHEIQVAKDKILHEPGVASFGHEKIHDVGLS